VDNFLDKILKLTEFDTGFKKSDKKVSKKMQKAIAKNWRGYRIRISFTETPKQHCKGS
jgi:hypothetical protein